MEFAISIALLVFVWMGFALIKTLLEEIERQRNPHHYLSKESISKQHKQVGNYYQNRYKRSGHEQFEKPKAPYKSNSESSSLAPIQKGEKLKPLPKEPQVTVDRKTQDRLYTLVNGDMRTARRLLDAVKERNPKRSYQWHWEKVIYDLERDKGAH
jgi:hypothetical protein